MTYDESKYTLLHDQVNQPFIYVKIELYIFTFCVYATLITQVNFKYIGIEHLCLKL